MPRLFILKTTSIVFFFTLVVCAQPKYTAREPDKKNKCPVCGMFVRDYPRWWSEILYADGTVQFFDGSKDMFKFYLRPHLYSKTKGGEIRKIYVRDYYSLDWIDAREARYVIDSDIYGPMGNELIPLKSKEDAFEFQQDHHGKDILRFKDVNWELLMRLSQGEEM